MEPIILPFYLQSASNKCWCLLCKFFVSYKVNYYVDRSCLTDPAGLTAIFPPNSLLLSPLHLLMIAILSGLSASGTVCESQPGFEYQLLAGFCSQSEPFYSIASQFACKSPVKWSQKFWGLEMSHVRDKLISN